MASRRNGGPLYGDSASPGKIFIGGLAKDTSPETFTDYFEKYGEITDSVIMKDRQTGRPRGFGFITYADPSVVDKVIEEAHVINGKQVEIKRTIPKGSSDFKTKKMFVGGIPNTLTEDEFKNFFSKYGNVVEHEIIRDHVTKRSRGFGFVIFDSEQVVDKMLANGNMIDMLGSKVEIKKAEPKKPSITAPPPAFASETRARPYNESFDGYGDPPYSGFGGGSAFGPPPYRSHGGFGSRIGEYGGYGGGEEFGRDYGGGSFRDEPSFGGYSSRFGPMNSGGFGGGYSGSGLGGFGRGGGFSGNYSSGTAGGYDTSPGSGYGGSGGLYGGRGGYAASSRYHPYAR